MANRNQTISRIFQGSWIIILIVVDSGTSISACSFDYNGSLVQCLGIEILKHLSLFFIRYWPFRTNVFLLHSFGNCYDKSWFDRKLLDTLKKEVIYLFTFTAYIFILLILNIVWYKKEYQIYLWYFILIAYGMQQFYIL